MSVYNDDGTPLEPIYTWLREAERIVGISVPDLPGKEKSVRDLTEQDWQIVDNWFARIEVRDEFTVQVFQCIQVYTEAHYSDERSQAIAAEKQATRDRFANVAKRISELKESAQQLTPDDIEDIKSDFGRGFSIVLPLLSELEEAVDSQALKYIMETKKRRGRPDHKHVRELVYSLASLYEIFSGEPFSFFRHRNADGDYELVSKGHQFVQRIVDVANFMSAPAWQISEKSVAIQCEKVVTELHRDSTNSMPDIIDP